MQSKTDNSQRRLRRNDPLYKIAQLHFFRDSSKKNTQKAEALRVFIKIEKNENSRLIEIKSNK